MRLAQIGQIAVRAAPAAASLPRELAVTTQRSPPGSCVPMAVPPNKPTLGHRRADLNFAKPPVFASSRHRSPVFPFRTLRDAPRRGLKHLGEAKNGP